MLADWAAGVPVAGGEFGVESDAFSALELAAAASVAEVAGDCLDAASSMTKSGSTMACSLLGLSLRVTMRLGLVDDALELAAAVLLDFRRSLAVAALLLEGAIAASKKGFGAVG